MAIYVDISIYTSVRILPRWLWHIFLYSRSANAFKILLNFNNSWIQNIIGCICIVNQTPFNECWDRKLLPSKSQGKPRKTIQIRHIIIEFIVELAAASLIVLVLLNFQKVCLNHSAFWLHFLPCMHLFESYRNGIQINCNAKRKIQNWYSHRRV